MKSILFLVFILVVSVFAAERTGVYTAQHARERMLARRATSTDLRAVVKYVTEAIRNLDMSSMQACMTVSYDPVPDDNDARVWEEFRQREDWKELITGELNRLGYRDVVIYAKCNPAVSYCAPYIVTESSIKVCW